MTSKRCAIGCESWPNDAKFNTCPICGEATRVIDKEPTVTPQEAQSIQLRCFFEEYYEKRCAERGISTHGPIRPVGLIA